MTPLLSIGANAWTCYALDALPQRTAEIYVCSKHPPCRSVIEAAAMDIAYAVGAVPVSGRFGSNLSIPVGDVTAAVKLISSSLQENMLMVLDVRL